MRVFPLVMIALLVLAAGCAQNRYKTSEQDEAPSLQASRMNMDSGWSVPPGQTTVKPPARTAERGPGDARPASRGGPGAGDHVGGYTPGTSPLPASPWSAPPPGKGRKPADRRDDRGMAPAVADRGLPPAGDEAARMNSGYARTAPGNRGAGALVPAERGSGRADDAMTGETGPRREAEPPPPEQPVRPIVPAFPAKRSIEEPRPLQRVRFAFDTSELSPQARAQLDANAQWLIANPEVVVRVEGHADDRGTSEYNLALGERRARKVREYLISKGVAPRQLKTVSFGEEMPLIEAANPEAWATNRRAEFALDNEEAVSTLPRNPAAIGASRRR